MLRHMALRLARRGAHERAGGPGGDDVLAGMHDDDADRRAGSGDLRIRLGIAVRGLVQLDAQKPEATADLLAHPQRALADAGGEDQRVEAAERDGARTHGTGDAVGEDVERKPSAGLVRALDRVVVSVDDERPAIVSLDGDDPARWSLAALELAPGTVGTVAVRDGHGGLPARVPVEPLRLNVT